MKFGCTGLDVNPIGFGGLPLKNLQKEQAVETVRHAFKKGIHFFDTSRAYGNSEKYIGEALEMFGQDARELYLLSTKTLGRTPEEIHRDVQKSVFELKTQYIDFYGLHKIASVEELGGVAAAGGLKELNLLRTMGIINYLYISSHNPFVLLCAMQYYPEFTTIMLPVNCMETNSSSRWWRVINEARERDIGMIGMKPFGGGIISNKRMALEWLFRYCEGILFIPGMKTKEEVDMNIRVFQEWQESGITPEEMCKVWDFVGNEKDRLKDKFCHRCEYCVPVCPNGINPSWIVQLWDLMEHRDGWASNNQKHINLVEDALKCKQCGLCEKACPYDLPLTKLVPENARRLRDKFRDMGLEVK